MRSIARLAVAGVAVAVAAYLSLATVEIVAWPAGGPVRVALLAPLSVLWWALIASGTTFSLAAVAWRHSGADPERLGRAATRLWLLLLTVVPFLPWLPDKAPLLLVLAGPLRWAIYLAAVGGAVAAVLPRLGPSRIAPGRPAIFVFSLLVYVVFGLGFASQPGFGGDEPHYLIISHSLLVDHDLDIANNHERRDYRAFFGSELRPDFLRRGQHGEIYSIHAPGLPALLVPAYAVAGARGAVLTVALLAALTALAVFDLAFLMVGRRSALLLWAATCLTIPFVPHAWLIYPELPGALIVAWSVRWLWRPPESNRLVVLHGVALAVLPWLHTKFVVLLACLAAVHTLRLWPRVKSIALLAIPIVLSGAAWLYFFYRLYGTLDPQAPYGSSTALTVLAANIPHGTLGLLFDQKFGLLVYSPVYALALAGLVIMLRDAALRPFAFALTFVGGAFLLSTTRFYMWWGGASAPARFLVPTLPLVAPAVAVGIDRLRGIAGRGVVALTLLLSLAVSAVCLASPNAAFLYSDPHGVAGIVAAVQGSAPLDISLPTFTEENWHAPLGLLLAWFAAVAAAAAVTFAAARTKIVRSAFGAAVTLTLTLGLASAALTGSRAPKNRAEVAIRGQLAVLHAYDASKVRAVDLGGMRRLSDDGVLSRLVLSTQRAPGSSSSIGASAGPFQLPEGEYEARVDFTADAGWPGELRASLSPQVVVGRTQGPLASPAVVRFTLPTPAPVSIGLTDPAAAAAVQRVEVRPVRLAAGQGRSNASVRVVESIEGIPLSYMAYADENAYPEGGVFWTRGTAASRVLIVPAGGAQLHLVLHIGPNGGRVSMDVDDRHLDVDLAANETRDVAVPLTPGRSRVALTVRAERAFRPAEVEPGSDDRRSLGCQVRPRVE